MGSLRQKPPAKRWEIQENRAHFRTNMNDLPDELLLEIIENFKPVLTHEVPDRPPLSCPRLQENNLRLKTLLSLTLSSRRLSRISEPVLYSSILCQSLTPTGQRRLTPLLSTLLETPSLAQYVTYVENLSEPRDFYTLSAHGAEKFFEGEKWY